MRKPNNNKIIWHRCFPRVRAEKREAILKMKKYKKYPTILYWKKIKFKIQLLLKKSMTTHLFFSTNFGFVWWSFNSIHTVLDEKIKLSPEYSPGLCAIPYKMNNPVLNWSKLHFTAFPKFVRKKIKNSLKLKYVTITIFCWK